MLINTMIRLVDEFLLTVRGSKEISSFPKRKAKKKKSGKQLVWISRIKWYHSGVKLRGLCDREDGRNSRTHPDSTFVYSVFPACCKDFLSQRAPSPTGEESLTIFLDKQKLNKKSEGSSNSSVVSLELLHQLAASYFTDRESTLRRLHHLQIATSAIKVMPRCMQGARCQILNMSAAQCLLSGTVGKLSISVSPPHVDVCFVVLCLRKRPPVLTDVETFAFA